MCILCWSSAASGLCDLCRRSIRPVPATATGGLHILSAAVHEGAARRLVHLLKYQGIEAAGMALAGVMASQLPGDAEMLVPVPRARLRRLRYGVDTARELADSLGGITGLPVVDCLAPALWWPSHAGAGRAERRAPRFRRLHSAPSGGLLVDDVLTTGATLVAAARLTGCRRAVTATRAERRRLE